MTTLCGIGLGLLAAVAAVWLYRAIAIYTPSSHGPSLGPDSIPDVPPQGLVSVIVPAKDEEKNIRAALDTLRAQDYPDLEIIVVDDRSTDGTAAAVRAVAAEDPRVRLVQVADLPAGWFGKPHAMHAGAREARGRWLLFVDADCRQARFSVRAGVHFLASRAGDMLSLWPLLEMHTFWERVVQPVAGSVLVAWFRPTRVNSPRWRTAFANGQYILIRRETYDAVGGWGAVRGELVEDIAMARTVKGAGHRLLNAVGKRLFTTRMYDTLPAMYRGWTRIYCGAFKRPGVLIVAMMMTFLFTLMPFMVLGAAAAALAGGDAGATALAAFALSAATVLLLFVTMRRLVILSESNPWHLVFYPVAVVIVLACQAAALVRSLGLAGVTWRGTTYKGGRVVR